MNTIDGLLLRAISNKLRTNLNEIYQLNWLSCWSIYFTFRSRPTTLRRDQQKRWRRKWSWPQSPLLSPN